MSDSQSEDIGDDLGDVAGEGSKVSVSTENDTEVDIEEMDSIADYEEAIPTEDQAPPEPSKPALVPNTPKKDPSADSKKDSSVNKQDAPPPKKEPSPAEKTPAPSKDSVSAPEAPKPAASSAEELNTKTPPKPSLPETAKEEKSVEPAADPSTQDQKPEIPSKEDTKSEKHSDSVSKKSNKSSHHDSAESKSRSKSKHSSKSSPKQDRSLEDDKSADKTPTPVTQSRSHRQSSRSSRSHSKTSRSTSDRKMLSQTPSTKTRSVPDEHTQSKSSYNDYQQSSAKASSRSQRKEPAKQHSSSYTTFALAESTPSHKNLFPETEEMSSVIDTNELVSVSVSSGLQSLRDMFFDDNDSHKGYLAPKDTPLTATYCSHRHGEDSEQPSRISHPSFNSHLEASPILLPDIDQRTYVKEEGTMCTSISENRLSDSKITPAEPPVEKGKLSPVATYSIQDSGSSDEDITPRERPIPNKDKKVDFAAGSDVISLTLDEVTEGEGELSKAQNSREHDIDEISVASEDIIKAIDRKYLSFTPNTLLCDISNIIPDHQNLVKVEGKHILNKEVCLEFMCWLENLNDLYMSIDYGKALNIFRRQESRFKLVLYECLKVAQGCGLDIGFERVAAMAHISFDVIYSMLPYCDGLKWYSQMVAGARSAENKLAEAYMLLCLGQLMIYGGDCFEAQRHLKNALVIVKQDFIAEQDLYNCIKHLFGFSVALCDCNKISERESGLIKMTEALVMTRNLFGTNSLETALGRLHIGIAYRSLYEDTALRLEGLDYVERAHEVLEDQLGHHPYMGICVQTLAQYHDDMLNINFSAEYNQALKCYQLATEIHRSAMGGHCFTARAITQMGDFYHRMADYKKAGDCLTEAYEITITYCPTDLVSALAAFHLGLLYMDDAYPEHDIFRGQNLLTSAANLLSKYGITYQRATMLQHMGIASEEAGLKHTFYRQESDNLKSVMFGVHKNVSSKKVVQGR